jgi:hypothetical protein
MTITEKNAISVGELNVMEMVRSVLTITLEVPIIESLFTKKVLE